MSEEQNSPLNNARSAYEHLCESYNIMDTISQQNRSIYAITIKCIKKDYLATDNELIKVLTELENCHKGEVKDFSIERDSIARLHLHATMIARKSLRYTLYKKRYWHIYITRLMDRSDLIEWSKYIHKDDEKSITEYFENGENHFLD